MALITVLRLFPCLVSFQLSVIPGGGPKNQLLYINVCLDPNKVLSCHDHIEWIAKRSSAIYEYRTPFNCFLNSLAIFPLKSIQQVSLLGSLPLGQIMDQKPFLSNIFFPFPSLLKLCSKLSKLTITFKGLINLDVMNYSVSPYILTYNMEHA